MQEEPIKIPKPSGDVTIHDLPFCRICRPNANNSYCFQGGFIFTDYSDLVFAASVLLFLAAYISGQIFREEPGRVEIPVLLRAVTAILVAILVQKSAIP